MSRSKNDFHPTSRCSKYRSPRTFLSVKYDNEGKKVFEDRHIKMKPYGRKNFIGYGEEEYCKEFGYYFVTQTNKKKERRLSKENIRKELEEI